MPAPDLVTVWHDSEREAHHYVCDDAPLKYLYWGQTPISGFRKIESDPNFRMEEMSFQLMRDVGRVSDPPTPWMYIVHTDIPDHIVDEYNEWYDKEHLPRLVTVPGVIRARRYTAISGNPRYLTAYELTDPNAFESPEGLKARKTPWTAKMRSLFENTRRRMCRLVTA